jgi:type IV secretion system protein VirD4
MTAKAAPPRAKSDKSKKRPPRRRRPPGRFGRAVRRLAARLARSAAPYGAGYGTVILAALATRHPGLAWAAAGGFAVHVAIRAHEAHRWHRAGGKAAQRRRRKYQGMASPREISRYLSPAAARKKSRTLFPDLDPDLAPVVIGRSGGRVIAGSRADLYLVLAPPQTMKTGWLSCLAADAPGALLATSSRGDLYRHTALPRSANGDLHVLNADRFEGLPANFGWSPAAGCGNPQTAILRAGDLMGAAPRDSSGKDAWHEQRGAELLRYMLHAAAVDGASMHEVYAWVCDPLSAEPASILAGRGYPGWADKFEALVAEGGDYLAGVAASAKAAISWMDDPVLAAYATPQGDGLDIAAMIRSGSGSIYLIGEDRAYGSFAPYFAAVTAEAFRAAKTAAEANGGRLAVPFTMLLDEAATICPVPLQRWSSLAAGSGITVVAGIQSKSQLPDRWGETAARTIWSNFTTKLISGGFTDAADLEELSAVLGTKETWHHVRGPDGSTTRQPDNSERLFPVERLRMLAPWNAVVMHRNTRPVQVTVTPVWDRAGYVMAPPHVPPAPQQPARPALEGLRVGGAIPMPAGAPAPALDADPGATDHTPQEAIAWQPR